MAGITVIPNGVCDKTKDTLGTVFYSSGSIPVPRYIVAKAKFV